MEAGVPSQSEQALRTGLDKGAPVRQQQCEIGGAYYAITIEIRSPFSPPLREQELDIRSIHGEIVRKIGGEFRPFTRVEPAVPVQIEIAPSIVPRPLDFHLIGNPVGIAVDATVSRTELEGEGAVTEVRRTRGQHMPARGEPHLPFMREAAHIVPPGAGKLDSVDRGEDIAVRAAILLIRDAAFIREQELAANRHRGESRPATHACRDRVRIGLDAESSTRRIARGIDLAAVE